MKNDLILSFSHRFSKRCIDLIFSFFGLLFIFPILVVGWLAAALSTHSNGIFIQQRIGRWGKKFNVVKLRTMIDRRDFKTNVTAVSDPRITKTGRLLRRAKIDELPQLLNVLCGQMSFVGPRPDVPGFADTLQGDNRALLELRPGITGPASLYFRNEERLLSEVDNPEVFNKDIIWPKKVFLNVEYLQNYSFKGDIKYIFQTIFGGGEQCQSAQEIKNDGLK
ncbi:MAG: sugar transferase [Limisphaerales bacterium]